MTLTRDQILNTPRSKFMTPGQQIALGNLPRHHWYCIEKTGGKGKGVARPGKTAKDRALKGERQ